MKILLILTIENSITIFGHFKILIANFKNKANFAERRENWQKYCLSSSKQRDETFLAVPIGNFTNKGLYFKVSLNKEKRITKQQALASNSLFF